MPSGSGYICEATKCFVGNWDEVVILAVLAQYTFFILVVTHRFFFVCLFFAVFFLLKKFLFCFVLFLFLFIYFFVGSDQPPYLFQSIF